MDIQILLEGIVIGFSIAMPVGPIGFLTIQRTLSQGLLIGLITGLGAATADAIFGSIAAFGLTIISDFLLKQQLWLRLIGGILLLLLGLKIILQKEVENNNGKIKKTNFFRSYTSSFFLTLTNPLTLLIFLGIFSRIHLNIDSISFKISTYLITGVFAGSALWFFTLSLIVSSLRKRFLPIHLLWINRISGAIILGFGIFTLLSFALIKF